MKKSVTYTQCFVAGLLLTIGLPITIIWVVFGKIGEWFFKRQGYNVTD